MTDRCRYPRCRQPADLIYMDRGLCVKHWNLLADCESSSAVEAAVLKALVLERDAEGWPVETKHSKERAE